MVLNYSQLCTTSLICVYMNIYSVLSHTSVFFKCNASANYLSAHVRRPLTRAEFVLRMVLWIEDAGLDLDHPPPRNVRATIDMKEEGRFS